MPKVGMKPIRRKQLIQATIESLHEHGMADTTIAKISKRAGVSSGIIAHYFGSKDELLEAVMRDMLSSLHKIVLHKVKQSHSALDALESIIDGHFTLIDTQPEATSIWLIFWAASPHHSTLHRLQLIHHARLRSNLRYWFKQCQPQHTQNESAELLATMIDGFLLRGALQPHGLDQAYTCHLCKAFIHQQLNRPPLL